MPSAARVLGLECLRCHSLFEEPGLFTGCPRCQEQGVAVNLSVKLDLAELIGLRPELIASGPGRRGLWRFGRLMPVSTDQPVTLGEGGTPLIPLERLGRRLGLSNLFAKDESQNPTWSYKDPHASRGWLPEVPAAPDDLDGVLAVVRERYGIELGG
jgi:threonine synthase